MKRTTIELPDDLDARLRFEAQRRDMTMSELSREAIATYLAADRPRRLRGAGAGDSGLADLAARLDDYLASDGFGEDAWSWTQARWSPTSTGGRARTGGASSSSRRTRERWSCRRW